MSNVLFARADFELATNYLFQWFGVGMGVARSLGYNVIDLPGPAFTFENVKDALERYEFAAIFLGGHGNATTITGQDHAEILKACTTDQIASGNVAVLLSCYTGQQLGPSMISKKTLSYIGWMNDFRFMVDTNAPILQDPLAEPFKEIFVEVVRRVLMGQKMSDVWTGTINKCNQWIDIIKPRPETAWSDVIACIQHDRDGMIVLGDQERYVTAPQRVSFGGAVPMALTLGVGAALTYFATK